MNTARDITPPGANNARDITPPGTNTARDTTPPGINSARDITYVWSACRLVEPADGQPTCPLDPFSTAVSFWGQTTCYLTGLSPNGTAALKGSRQAGEAEPSQPEEPPPFKKACSMYPSFNKPSCKYGNPITRTMGTSWKRLLT